ncbi:MAG: aspartyl protease [Bdellovibrionales bacterium RIFOXYD1_FULL_53_11]|nr:MAG: aspartyl protease [Bdellovibrionales bacterium RIFOXYD1_FULL_53_11]
MGLLYIQGTVTGPTGEQDTLQFLLDTGVIYTVLPLETWRKIRLKPQRSICCRLSDGTVLARKVAECHIRVTQGNRSTPVVLGEQNDEALLGMVTLEELGMVMNILTRRIQPLRMIIA